MARLSVSAGGADVILDLAYDCRGIKKWKHCRRLFEDFLEEWPSDERGVTAQRLVAKACLKAGDNDGATAAIEKLLANYSDSRGIGYELAELADDYADDGRYDKAAELYKLAVERWPSSKWAVEAQNRLARMYVQVGDYEEADAAAGELIESFSNAEGIAGAVEDVADMYQMAGSQDKSYPLHRYVVEHWPEDERAIWCQMKAVNSRIAGIEIGFDWVCFRGGRRRLDFRNPFLDRGLDSFWLFVNWVCFA